MDSQTILPKVNVPPPSLSGGGEPEIDTSPEEVTSLSAVPIIPDEETVAKEKEAVSEHSSSRTWEIWFAMAVVVMIVTVNIGLTFLLGHTDDAEVTFSVSTIEPGQPSAPAARSEPPTSDELSLINAPPEPFPVPSGKASEPIEIFISQEEKRLLLRKLAGGPQETMPEQPEGLTGEEQAEPAQ